MEPVSNAEVEIKIPNMEVVDAMLDRLNEKANNLRQLLEQSRQIICEMSQGWN